METKFKYRREIEIFINGAVVTEDVLSFKPWCLGPTTWIFCTSCMGKQFQVIYSIGNFVPYQTGGGALILAVSDNNELFFDVSPYVETFNLKSKEKGGSLCLVNAKVKVVGTVTPQENFMKILTTYDEYANVTKIYVDEKFVGTGSLDGFQIDEFDDLFDNPDQTSQRREEISIGTLGVARKTS